MMRGPMIVSAGLAFLLYLHGSVRAQDGKKSQPEGADSAAAAQQAAREALAKFEKPLKGAEAGIRNWKVRMECLVALMRAGPAAVPVLVDALKAKSPDTREFAAQALGFLADPSAKPALVQAAEDKEQVVRLHAIKALGRLGRLEATPKYRQIAEKDQSVGIQFEMTFALTRDDEPDPGPICRALSGYDLTRMDSARPGKAAPEFALTDTSGKTWRLDQFRGKQSVLLVFLQKST
jgi:hypothetical protein